MMSAALSRFVTIWAGRTHQVQADPTAEDRQTSSEVQRGVALQPFGLACLCVTFLLVVLVPWVGGVGH